MNAQAYFNKPRRPFDIRPLIADIEGAQQKVCVASAWFTDTQIADAIIASQAPEKGVFVNQGDTKRGETAAYRKLYNYFSNINNPNRYRTPQDVYASTHEHEASWDDCPDAQAWWGLTELGSGDWNEGVMHHKFAVIDERIVWTGSYNLTFHARNNYENLLRIESAELAQTYWQEIQQLGEEFVLYMGSTQCATANGCFRCSTCERLFTLSEIGYDGETWKQCVSCARRER